MSANFTPWERLINFLPPEKVQQDLRERLVSRYLQRIEDSWAWRINLDYYPVSVKVLPKLEGNDPSGKPWASDRLSGRANAAEFLRYIRININTFVDTTKCSFLPASPWDDKAWRGTLGPEDPRPAGYELPVGTVISINMKALGGWAHIDSGSVACTESDDKHWIFSTVFDWIEDWHHPVSGNREFGYFPNTISGSENSPTKWSVVDNENNYTLSTHTFYTKGADAATTVMDALGYKLAYTKGHELWLTLQNKLKIFVDQHEGSAEILPPVRSPDGYAWSDVRAAIFHRASDP